MKEIYGNLFEPTNEVNAICIPTNGMIKNNGHAIMGKGIALEATKRYPGIEKTLGLLLKIFGNQVQKIYNTSNFSVISFPTKHDWKNDSDLNLIKTSANQLIDLANKNNWLCVWLPIVGCGLGRLKWSVVREELSKVLDDRFVIVLNK